SHPTMARMNRPAPVEVCYKNMRFLITHNPTNATLSTFLEDLKKYGATTVVRVCEVTYDKTPLEKDGITVMVGGRQGGCRGRLPIEKSCWSQCSSPFLEDARGCSLQNPFLLQAGGFSSPTGVGLGWGSSPATPLTIPTLLCPVRKRRGAINSKQLTYLEKYRPKQRLRFKDPHNHKNKCCIM
ncbi:TP4A3 phosphatase, partial [Cepphus grylle]|nr:TP4A3 phosphatase [Cepphus grylle]